MFDQDPGDDLVARIDAYVGGAGETLELFDLQLLEIQGLPEVWYGIPDDELLF